MLAGMSYGRRSAQDVKGSVTTMAGMSEWWDGRRDQHLSILGALTGLSAMIGLASIFVLGFSSNGPLEIGGADYDPTGLSIVGAMVGIVGLILTAPALLDLLNHRASLRSYMSLTSVAEMRKQRAEADASASRLGPAAEERLAGFLKEHGLKRRG